MKKQRLSKELCLQKKASQAIEMNTKEENSEMSSAQELEEAYVKAYWVVTIFVWSFLLSIIQKLPIGHKSRKLLERYAKTGCNSRVCQLCPLVYSSYIASATVIMGSFQTILIGSQPILTEADS